MLARLLILSLLCAPGCAGLFTSPANKLTEQADRLLRAQPHPVALPRELDKALSVPYVVEPGDVLLIQPADYDSPLRLPGDQPVLPDGTINLGRYGRIQAAGKTLDEIEATVRLQLQRNGEGEAPAINARIVTRQSKVYYVLGEVNSPGAFVLTGRETVLDAVLQAGGLNAQAAPDRIFLARPTRPCDPRVVLPVCYTEIVLGDTSTNYQLQAGDRVFVSARAGCEGGLFHKPAPCPPCGKEQRAAHLPLERCDGCAPPRPMRVVQLPIPAPVVAPPASRPEVLPTPLPKNPPREKVSDDDTSR